MRRLLDGLYLAAGGLGAFCVFLIFVLMIVAGVGRQLNWHVSGLNDVVAWLCAAAAFFAMAHAFRHGDFVRVTLLLEQLGPARRRWFELGCLGIAVVALGYLAWWACRFTWESWAFHEVAQGLWAVPIWIPQLSFAFGSLLFLLAVVDEFVGVLLGAEPTYVRLVRERHAQGDFSSDL
jgi:TRAP-type C4-dicarboxylate transport system permease small subunit